MLIPLIAIAWAIITLVIIALFSVEEKDNHCWDYCDDRCLDCDQNDWCPFSEVKRRK